ncbi:MAG TPA: ABC transporter substrate-binding protein, partial [Acidimicrobiia bacterium]|nr:ABC transporter substrate-binding protein [Acidimicrobiia bacterium]
MRRRRGWIGALLALALVGAACSESGGNGDGEGADRDRNGDQPAAEGSTAGLTDTTINMAAIIPDLAPLVEAGLAPDFGDFRQNIGVFVDEFNAEGVAGRQIEMDYHFFAAGSTAAEQQAACLAATQDSDAFVVMSTGGTHDETILCVTEQNQRLMLVMAGAFVSSVYERSEGRLFTNGMEIDRLMRNMVDMLDEEGELEDRTLGVVRADFPRDDEVVEALRGALDDQGYEVAEEVVLPCEGNRCEQTDVGVQRLMAADVDGVFSLLGVLPYPAFVNEAGAQGYDPQWFSSDFENQVLETTAKFFEGSHEPYDGALGVTTSLDDVEVDEPRQDCNDRFTEVTGIEYEFDTDAWRAVGNACEMLTRIVNVIEAIEADGQPLNHTTFIE